MTRLGIDGRPTAHYLGNSNASKECTGGLIRIRLANADLFKEVSRWTTPGQRGRAVIRKVLELQGSWMQLNMSDDLIDQYNESDTLLDPKQWMESRKN
jgi:hypothetical protein